MKQNKTNYKPGQQDLCQTPDYAVHALVDTVPFSGFVDHVHDPACGAGTILKAITTSSIERPDLGLSGSDLSHSRAYVMSAWNNRTTPRLPAYCLRTDALAEPLYAGYPVPNKWTWVITNPPYSSGMVSKFVHLFAELGKRHVLAASLLIKVEALSTRYFASAVEIFGEPDILFMTPRVNFYMPNEGWTGSENGSKSSAHFPVCWVTWSSIRLRAPVWTTIERTRQNPLPNWREPPLDTP